MRFFKYLFIVMIAIGGWTNSIAQASTYVDKNGIMRWTKDKEELCVFGTNYAPPFAYWKQRLPIGANQFKAIDEDVYHIARLGIDGYRIHVWPDYITDSIGNLVDNEHLQLFDYLVFKLKERGIKLFITPMYLSEEGNGFVSACKGKNNCINDPANWGYQKTYLKQFVSHINPYTKLSLNNDPDVLAFAITNEPSHWKRPDLVTSYINTLAKAMRDAGVENPILYNMTTCADQIKQVLASDIQGGTFQWYPSGLTSNHNLRGNMLPNVDKYYIPFDDELKKSGRTKFVYEYSPADIGASGHIYPAMARSFREAGFQFAAFFSYDAMHQAYCNIAYKTHFLNLAYTPKKAIGLLIASEAFRRVNLYESYGRYPKNNHFEDISLSHEKELVELVSTKKFLYSNNTQSLPPAPSKLEQIAGTGSSPLIKYSGTGAYFLDKIDDGVWRLEVMPDAHWVKDPFFVPSIKREVAVTISKKQHMSVKLPNLGTNFNIKALNDGNKFSSIASETKFDITPGCYLLVKEGLSTSLSGKDKWKNIQLGEFHQPSRKLENTYVLHDAVMDASVNSDVNIKAKIIAPFEAEQVELIIAGYGGGKVIPMTSTDTYNFEAKIPSKYISDPQIVRYYISFKKGDLFFTYPSGDKGEHLLSRRIYADDRLLTDGAPYSFRVVEISQAITLFDADRDWPLTKNHRRDKINLFPSDIPEKSFMHIAVNNLNSEESNYSLETYCAPALDGRSKDLDTKTDLVLYGHSLNNKPCPIQISLLMKSGDAYAANLELDLHANKYSIPLKSLQRVKSVLLPRPYPKFHAFWFEPSIISDFDIREVESIQISIGPGIAKGQLKENHGVAIGWLSLE